MHRAAAPVHTGYPAPGVEMSAQNALKLRRRVNGLGASHARCSRAAWSALRDPHNLDARDGGAARPVPVVKRGGRKEMPLPGGGSQPRRTGSRALVEALARAFHRKRMP